MISDEDHDDAVREGSMPLPRPSDAQLDAVEADAQLDEEGNLTIRGMRERALAAVYAYRGWGPHLDRAGDIEEAILDLAASLHHLHDSLGEDCRDRGWEGLAESADHHYQAEAHNAGPYADPPVTE